MKTLSLSSPAKLNLSLKILSKREDGFHEIDTLMVKLPGLADQIEIGESSEFRFHCDDPSLPLGEENLIVKAVRAFETAAKTNALCSISLKKLIPHGAGLGGGSSNAAVTLLGLNQLFDFPLRTEELHGIAAKLGSDIPFFLTTGAARCTGRGEIVTAVPSPSALRVFLLKPSFSVATPEAYQRWQESHEIPSICYRVQNYSGVALENSLERPVFQKHRFLAEIKEWLLDRRETQAALMSGSGSTVFGVLKADADAETLAASARAELDPSLWHWTGFTEA